MEFATGGSGGMSLAAIPTPRTSRTQINPERRLHRIPDTAKPAFPRWRNALTNSFPRF
jgi:hypothetical protein